MAPPGISEEISAGGGPDGSVILGVGTETEDGPAAGVLPTGQNSLHSGANIQYAKLTITTVRANPMATEIGEAFIFGIGIP